MQSKKKKILDTDFKTMKKKLIRGLENNESIKDILGMDQKTLEFCYSIGHLFYQEELYRKALLIFSYLVLLDSDNKKYRLSLASTYQMRGMYNLAIENYIAAGKQAPKDPKMDYHIAECFYHLGELHASMHAIKSSLEKIGTNKKFATLRKEAHALQIALEAGQHI